jgi:pSer/pThr/pTyr-binding forkhead associated (FHA) protein
MASKKPRKRPASRRAPKRGRRPRAAPQPAPAPDDLTRTAASSAAAGPATAGATLRVLRCPDARLVRREFLIGSDDVTLGRDASSTIALADPDVSRHHARIVRTGNSHVLVDMESTNGTSVNGKRVSEVTLRPGDRLLLGATALVYEA